MAKMREMVSEGYPLSGDNYAIRPRKDVSHPLHSGAQVMAAYRRTLWLPFRFQKHMLCSVHHILQRVRAPNVIKYYTSAEALHHPELYTFKMNTEQDYAGRKPRFSPRFDQSQLRKCFGRHYKPTIRKHHGAINRLWIKITRDRPGVTFNNDDVMNYVNDMVVALSKIHLNINDRFYQQHSDLQITMLMELALADLPHSSLIIDTNMNRHQEAFLDKLNQGYQLIQNMITESTQYPIEDYVCIQHGFLQRHNEDPSRLERFVQSELNASCRICGGLVYVLKPDQVDETSIAR
jgi:hypothetical protein